MCAKHAACAHAHTHTRKHMQLPKKTCWNHDTHVSRRTEVASLHGCSSFVRSTWKFKTHQFWPLSIPTLLIIFHLLLNYQVSSGFCVPTSSNTEVQNSGPSASSESAQSGFGCGGWHGLFKNPMPSPATTMAGWATNSFDGGILSWNNPEHWKKKMHWKSWFWARNGLVSLNNKWIHNHTHTLASI